MIDVVIQTLNEEVNLPHTLRSLEGGWVRRVFVVDSGSTDATRAIAVAWGAEVVEHPWEGYARQKNWALAHLPLVAPWVLIVDADEAVSPPLRDKLVELANAEPRQGDTVGYAINRVFIFNGRPIWRCGYYPSWNMRFFRRGLCRYEERRVHEHMVCDGPTAKLDRELRLIHEDRRGLEHFFAKHNRYSTLEAIEICENPESWPGWAGFVGDQTRRRRFMKSRVLPRIPMPWTTRMFYMLVLRGGLLDGWAGVELSNLVSIYEKMIRAKCREHRRRDRRMTRPPPAVSDVKVSRQPPAVAATSQATPDTNSR